MKRATSISLGSSLRDKEVALHLEGQPVLLRREGTGGDEERLRRRFEELDGRVDALGLGGFELELRIDKRRYPLRAGQRLVRNVKKTPVLDGGGLKQTLERQVFTRAGLAKTRFRRALVLVGADRWGLSQAVTEVAGEVIFADLYFALGVPVRLRTLAGLRRLASAMMPLVGLLPISMLYPTGKAQEAPQGRFPRLWEGVDLVAGDFHYLRSALPSSLEGCTVVTNTTTPDDVELLRGRRARMLITTTPVLEGRSFGTNALEAALTAWTGSATELPAAKLEELIERFDIRPTVTRL